MGCGTIASSPSGRGVPDAIIIGQIAEKFTAGGRGGKGNDMETPDRILRLRHRILDYDWGSPTAIADLLGIANPDGKPMAELWMGAHPKAPSAVETAAGWIGLDELTRRHPDLVLGPALRRRFGDAFPFLFKVIAAARPLSIQVHPDAAQAARGFARENRAGLPLDSPRRNYRDPNPKPELIYACGCFRLLCGLRDARKTAELLGRLCPSGLRDEAAQLAADPGREGLKRLVAGLLALSGDEGRERRRDLIAEALAQSPRLNEPGLGWIAHLARFFPDDIGVLAPAWMNPVILEPGRALFLPPGTLHAYVDGLGIELMADSDNVIRGGLTPKHVDAAELLATIDFAQSGVHEIAPEPAGACETRYVPPVGRFALSVIRTRPGASFRCESGEGVEILLCMEGEGVLEEAGASPRRLAVSRGASFLVPAAVSSYALSGELLAFRAFVPQPVEVNRFSFPHAT